MPNELKPPTERIPIRTWARTPKLVRAEMVTLVQELAEVKQRLAKAEEQLRRNSQNSSQPPSQDKPGQTPAHENGTVLKTHQRGGQRGHAGHHRALLPVEQVNEVVVHRPVQCAECGALLLGDDGAPYRYQVTELPCLKPYVTEHQVQTVTCPMLWREKPGRVTAGGGCQPVRSESDWTDGAVDGLLPVE